MPPGSIPVPSTTELAAYPSGEYPEPDTTDPSVEADVQQAQGVVAAYLAKQANEQLGLDPTAFDSILSTQIVIDRPPLRHRRGRHDALAVAQAHYSGGGPQHDGLAVLRRRTGLALLGDVPGDRA